MKLFLDTNVVLDVLADRKPYADDAACVLAVIERGDAQGFIAAHTATTLFYSSSARSGCARRRVLSPTC